MSSSPLSVIESLPPQFSAAAAGRIALEHYGLGGEPEPLVSERDQNFLLQDVDGSRWVLKIANAAEDPQFTDFQIQALRHIAAGPAAPPVPALRATLDGADQLQIAANGHTHVVRMVRWLPGRPLEVRELRPALCRNLGEFLAGLGISLRDFRHAGGRQALLWDMRQAPALRELLPFIADTPLRAELAACLDDFASRALPRFAELRTQVIHSDFNPDNILLDPQDPEQVAGVIDFGDIQRAPLVVDVAIAASYLRNECGDPLEHIAEFVAGYHRTTPLLPDEIDLLYDLINARLAATVAILAWRSGARAGGDAYLDKAAASESSAAPFLQRLREWSRAQVSQRLRTVCRAVDSNPGQRPL